MRRGRPGARGGRLAADGAKKMVLHPCDLVRPRGGRQHMSATALPPPLFIVRERAGQERRCPAQPLLPEHDLKSPTILRNYVFWLSVNLNLEAGSDGDWPGVHDAAIQGSVFLPA